ncbi:Crp/Fnr family transcriptional regulator [Marivirga sp. S37H4]|uniref:Crp/Fnr family transcriptional regulator n=1 Tax=Marivirga aurantiaca TaxID=2802615 RepID=A0A935C9M4_9BACT|nr:Crp/Fnr family transcriptional regulator [Marivirga aurantiaca]MBK6266064.1 Crp/Fnr family transcriptional regulator [Marivirga aurantiaca]
MENELFNFISKYIKLTEEERKVITDLAIFRTYKKGTVLLKEGDLSNDGYFVIKGCIRTYHVIDGEEKITAFYTESESCTPLCSVNKKPSEYYVSCVEDSILSVGNSEKETDLFEKFPRFETVCRLVSEELLVKNQATFDDFKTSTPEQRYLNLLNTRPDLIQRVPQYQIASYLGMKPQSLSRIRKRIK